MFTFRRVIILIKEQFADYTLGFSNMYMKSDDMDMQFKCWYNVSKLGDIWLACSRMVILDA